MNRWLMPFLVTGVVSAIALFTWSPLARSLKATADPYTVATRTESSSLQQFYALPSKTPLPPRAVVPLTNRPVTAPTAVSSLPWQALTQLLAPRACYGAPAAPVTVQCLTQTGGAVPPKTTTSAPGVGYPREPQHAVPADGSALTDTLAALINQQRRYYGLPPLTLVPTLTLAAYRHSLDMATQTTPTHQGSDGSSGGSRMLAAGYQWQTWAEVIGWGFADPDSMVAWWLNDADHRTVLLSPGFTEFGIGYATLGNTQWQNYWTVNFGRPIATYVSSVPAATADVTQPPALTPLPTATTESTIAQSPSATQPTNTVATCPTASAQSYHLIPMTGVDLTHPAPVHGDLNLAQRGYTRGAAQPQLLDLAGPIDGDAPQLAQLLVGNPSPQMANFYQVADWQWSCGAHGCRGQPLSSPEVTLLGLQTQLGAVLQAPERQASIYRDNEGHDFVAVVLYAEAGRLTLAYTRDGSVANGYVVHLEQLCVDPHLVQRYDEADRGGRQQLPALQHRQPLGTAAGIEVQVAIRDRGAFLDPRSRKDWWHGY